VAHPKGSKNRRSLRMGPIGFVDTSARNDQCSLRYNPEELSFQLLYSGSQKSRGTMSLWESDLRVFRCCLVPNELDERQKRNCVESGVLRRECCV
jgi:hypothetical protein